MLKGNSIELHPFVAARDAEALYDWFYDPSCKAMWRHHPKSWNQDDMAQYPRMIGGEVFMIDIGGIFVGFCQAIPDHKTNRGCYVGILLDKASRRLHITHEVFVVLFNHLFNKQGYNKVIIEVLSSEGGFQRGLEAAGFLFEGKLQQEAFLDGKFVDESRFSMISSDYNPRYKHEADQWAVSSQG